MVDVNQVLSMAEAADCGRALGGEGAYSVMKAIHHDDYAGGAAVTRARAAPIQIGENFSRPQAMAARLTACAFDYVMPDLKRIGGVSHTGSVLRRSLWWRGRDVLSLLPRDQHSSASRDADFPLARICGLSGANSRRAASRPQWHGDRAGSARYRSRLVQEAVARYRFSCVGEHQAPRNSRGGEAEG